MFDMESVRNTTLFICGFIQNGKSCKTQYRKKSFKENSAKGIRIKAQTVVMNLCEYMMI